MALWQANHVAELLRAAGNTVSIEVIRTTGDRMQQPGFVPAPEPDGVSLDAKGMFIKEIEEALASGQIDLAVHSLKDLPTTLDARFTLAAIPERADPRDAFVCEPFWALHTLPSGGRVGTTSPRRRAQLLALRPDLEFIEVRGNIDTRLRKLDEGVCDALVLACAGLDRLGRTEHVHQRFDRQELCPAPGQGALALETRSAAHPLDSDGAGRDPAVLRAVAALDCSTSRYAVTAERAMLQALGGGCLLPIGALCELIGVQARLTAQVVAPDGEAMLVEVVEAATTLAPETLGSRVGARLIERGALDLLPESWAAQETPA